MSRRAEELAAIGFAGLSSNAVWVHPVTGAREGNGLFDAEDHFPRLALPAVPRRASQAIVSERSSQFGISLQKTNRGRERLRIAGRNPYAVILGKHDSAGFAFRSR
jgi:hypothetical protein